MKKCNLDGQVLRMTMQARENFLPGKLGDTVKIHVSEEIVDITDVP